MSRGPASTSLERMNTTDVQHTLHEMWETRPARPRDEREVAGVAAAIARRYDVDPVLVRVAFVVAAFLGIGAALYLAGWIVLPEEPAADGAPPARRPRPLLLAGLVVATLGNFWSFFGSRGGVVLPLLAVAVLLVLLHRSRGERGRRPAETGGQASGVSLVKEPVAQQPPATPPSWDPLGAAPFAWDLPEPAPEPAPAPRRRRPPVTLVTLGTALLAGAGTSAILLGIGSLTLPYVPVVLGVMLAVLGAGLLAGSFLHAGRGIIPFALVLAALTWGMLAAPFDRFTGPSLGDLVARPVNAAQLLPVYERGAGDITLDLRGLDLSVPGGGTGPDLHTSVRDGLGDVRVLVAPDADVTFHGSAGMGDVMFGGQHPNGPGAHVDVTQDLGADGVRSGRLLVIDARTGAGTVEVTRG